MTRLDDATILRALSDLPGWRLEGASLRKTYALPDFKGSMAFVTKVALHAEAMGHHPEILVSESRVAWTLSTHDAGGLTEKDLTLARRIDS
jgi:4a-hydroxytetrahydrobiopterin dehydratase